MRTTLNIPDDLYRSVKVAAASRGVTVTSVIEEALRAALMNATAGVDVELPVSERRGGLRAGVDLNDPAQLYDLLYGDADRTSIPAPVGPQ